jgi:hypothetical protein
MFPREFITALFAYDTLPYNLFTSTPTYITYPQYGSHTTADVGKETKASLTSEVPGLIPAATSRHSGISELLFFHR